MLSKSLIALIKSLKYKKFRESSGLFIAEGDKIMNDLINVSSDRSLFKIHTLLATPEWLKTKKILPEKEYNLNEISEDDLRRISLLKTPNKVMALVKIPGYTLEDNFAENDLVLVLDDIQDPGNLGTIIRIAHWFGIKNIICSEHSADIYNPKTVQSAMGSLWSVRIFYRELKSFLSQYQDHESVPVIGTFLSGSSIYSMPRLRNGLIVLGNESHGISDDLVPYIHSRISIPPYSDKYKPDSINVAQATAIICYELRRNQNL
jgi:TrmH family RNA methyltransferase